MPPTLRVFFSAALCALAFAGPTAADPLLTDARLQAAGLTRFWDAQLPLKPHDSVKEGHLVDEALYIITEGGTIFAVQADVGLIRWAEKLTVEDFEVYRPAHLRRTDGRGPVVILTTTSVFVFDRFNGDLIRTFTPEFDLGSPPAGVDNLVFLGSADGRVYSLLLRGSQSSRPVSLWEVWTGGPVTAAPVLYADNRLLLASEGGRLFSCYASDKTFAWGFTTGGPIRGAPAVDESGVYVASADRSLYKVDRDSGTMIWRRRFPCQLVEGPVVTAHTVFQYCESDGLSAIDADAGVQKWRLPAGRALAAHAEGRDVVFTQNQRMLILNHDTGEVLHGFDIHFAAGAVTNTRNEAVYLLGRDGRILCARPVGVPYLRRQDVTAARDRLNLPPLDSTEAGQGVRTETSKASDAISSDPLRSRRDRQP